MSDSNHDRYDREGLLEELVRAGYIAGKSGKSGSCVTIYVRRWNKGGGELSAILSRYGYSPRYPSPYSGDAFEFKINCEPILWQQDSLRNCPHPSWWDEERASWFELEEGNDRSEGDDGEL